MADWICQFALPVTLAHLFGANLATASATFLLGQTPTKLSRKQKSRLLIAFLSLLAIAVCLVLFAMWMSRAMRKYMRDEGNEPTPLPETDLWKLQAPEPVTGPDLTDQQTSSDDTDASSS